MAVSIRQQFVEGMANVGIIQTAYRQALADGLSKVLSRRLCSSADMGIDYRDLNDEYIPLIVPSQSIKKAFIVQRHKYTHKSSYYACKLTKTVLKQGLPSEVHTILEEMDRYTVERSLQSLKTYFVRHWTAYSKADRSLLKRSEEALVNGLDRDLLKILYLGCHDLVPSEGLPFIAQEMPHLQTDFLRCQNFYRCEVQPSLVIRGCNPGVPFAGADLVTGEVEEDFSPMMMGHKPRGIIKMRNNPGFNSLIHNRFAFPRLILMHQRMQNEEHCLTDCIHTAFTALVSASKAMNAVDGCLLPVPLTTTCIHTDGQHLCCTSYQLNTLNLLNHHGVWNCAYTTGMLPLFRSTPGARPVFVRGWIKDLFEDDLNVDVLTVLLRCLFSIRRAAGVGNLLGPAPTTSSSDAENPPIV